MFSIKSVKHEKLLVYLFNQFFSCNTDRLGGNMSAGDGAPHTSHWLRTTENTPGQFLSLSLKTPMVQITHTILEGATNVESW